MKRFLTRCLFVAISIMQSGCLDVTAHGSAMVMEDPSGNFLDGITIDAAGVITACQPIQATSSMRQCVRGLPTPAPYRVG